MTSSLVGSEMCIRDRGAGMHSPKLEPRAVGVLPAPSPAGGRRRASRPVSYTHLTLPTICSV
eukprot:6039334-Prorocentrum_lima.AAC.1